eukprot:UN09976
MLTTKSPSIECNELVLQIKIDIMFKIKVDELELELAQINYQQEALYSQTQQVCNGVVADIASILGECAQ